jgi:hypothetical protein
MAWQSPSTMNSGGAASGGDSNGPAGTEYTLQGKLESSNFTSALRIFATTCPIHATSGQLTYSILRCDALPPTRMAQS